MVSVFFPNNYQWDLVASLAISSKGSPGEVMRLSQRLQGARLTADVNAWYEQWTEVADASKLGRWRRN